MHGPPDAGRVTQRVATFFPLKRFPMLGLRLCIGRADYQDHLINARLY